MVSTKTKKRSFKTQAFLNLAILAVALVVINLLANQYYHRFDLTKEKKYTLSNTTNTLLKNLDTKLTFNVYLEGDLSTKFKQLKGNIRDMLAEFNEISGGKVQYDFTNPLEGKSLDDQSNIIEQFEKQGLIPYYDQEENETQTQVTRLFPGAKVIDGKGNEYIINFLTTQLGKAEEEAINNSIENLEYELANIVRKASSIGQNKKIGFLRGHGELDELSTFDIRNELKGFYKVSDVTFNLNLAETLLPIQDKVEKSADPEKEIFPALLQHLKSFKGLIMAKPTQPFSKAEVFLLDQYIMQGGKVLFLIDPVFAEYDTLALYERMLSTNYDLGELPNMLYIYGIRLNNDILMDSRCNDIVFQAKNGLFRNFAWTYYPIFTDNGNNPISKNMEGIWGRFVSTLKPIVRDNVVHTPILLSSDKSRISNSPLMLDLGIVMQNNNPSFLKSFNKGQQVCGVLSTGQFQSVFKGRNTESFTQVNFKEEVKNNSMIVVADGDIVKNQVKADGNGYFPLGFDMATKRSFANKKFIVNCVDYLCDDAGLIEIRNKEYELRLLDKNKVKANKKKWQILNIAVPLGLVVVFGLINAFIRRQKFNN